MTRLTAPALPASLVSLPATLVALSACSSLPVTPAVTPAVTRYPNASPTSPTSRAVEVGPGTALVFVSGQTPEVAQPQAERYGAVYWGDTEAQSASVLQKIEAQLKSVGLTMGDVVKMQVYLVGDPAQQGRMDTAGFGRAYARHFGTAEQPARPARTTVQIAGLGLPGMLVEIDVIAARR
jgi:enamine deaminase RidA (YjgF/YER057c/UK114 family)